MHPRPGDAACPCQCLDPAVGPELLVGAEREPLRHQPRREPRLSVRADHPLVDDHRAATGGEAGEESGQAAIARQHQEFVGVQEADPFAVAMRDRIGVGVQLRRASRPVRPRQQHHLVRRVQPGEHGRTAIGAGVVVDHQPVGAEQPVPGDPLEQIGRLVADQTDDRAARIRHVPSTNQNISLAGTADGRGVPPATASVVAPRGRPSGFVSVVGKRRAVNAVPGVLPRAAMFSTQVAFSGKLTGLPAPALLPLFGAESSSCPKPPPRPRPSCHCSSAAWSA